MGKKTKVTNSVVISDTHLFSDPITGHLMQSMTGLSLMPERLEFYASWKKEIVTMSSAKCRNLSISHTHARSLCSNTHGTWADQVSSHFTHYADLSRQCPDYNCSGASQWYTAYRYRSRRRIYYMYLQWWSNKIVFYVWFARETKRTVLHPP